MSRANKGRDRSPSTPSNSCGWSLTADSAALIRRTVAANLRHERERNDLSHRALASRCGLIPGSVARIEGAQREARISTLVTIAIGLSVPLPSLLVGIPSPSAGHREWVGDSTLAANWTLSPENLRLVRAILGRNLLQSRKRAGMSQQALAGRSHVGEDTIIRTERGHQEPKLATAVAWSFALSVPLLFLLIGLPSVAPGPACRAGPA